MMQIKLDRCWAQDAYKSEKGETFVTLRTERSDFRLKSLSKGLDLTQVPTDVPIAVTGTVRGSLFNGRSQSLVVVEFQVSQVKP